MRYKTSKGTKIIPWKLNTPMDFKTSINFEIPVGL
jgi:hypothetical protein